MPSPFLRSGLLCTALAAAGATVTNLAHAAPADDTLASARSLFVQAEQDEDAGRWAEAKAKLEQVANVKLTPGVRYHIALCDEHLGRVATALAEFTTAENEAAAENAEDVLRLVGREMTPLTSRVPRLSIRVSPAVPGTELMLDGAIVRPEQIGATVPVDPGLHHVEATAPGRAPTRMDVTLHERDVTFLDVILQPTTAQASAATSPGNAALSSSPPSASRPGPNLVAPVVMTAAAAVLVGTGIGAYFAADSAHSNAVAECAQSFTLAAGACDALKQPVRTWDWVAASAWAGAAVSATVAVVLWAQKSGAPAQAGSGSGTGQGSGQLVVGPGSIRVVGSF